MRGCESLERLLLSNSHYSQLGVGGKTQKMNIMNQEDRSSVPLKNELTFAEIFTQIWTSPRAVFFYVKDNANAKHVLFLLILAGIVNGLDKAASNNSGDDMGLIGVIAISTIAGGLFGWITFLIYAHLLKWTGSWLNGISNSDNLINIVAYSMIPSIIGLAPVIVQIGFFGNGLFQRDFDPSIQGGIGIVLIMITGLLQIILAIYSLVLLVIGISVAQNFSVGKSILNAVLPLLLFIFPIIIIVLAIDLFS